MANQVTTLKMEQKFKQTTAGEIPVDWGIKPIREICDILDNQRVPLNQEQRNSMRGNIPYCGANGVVDHINQHIFDEELILIAEDGGYFDEYQSRAIAYLITGKTWVNNHAHVLRVRPSDRTLWIYYSLVHKNLIPFIKGGTRSKLNQEDLREILIPIPPLHEQKKIAEILSSVDDAIETTNAVIKKTVELKSCLLHQLIYRGFGHTDLKETAIGRLPKNWKIVPLDSIANVDRGKFQHRPRNEPRFYGGQYPFIQTGEVTASGGRIRTYTQTLNEDGLAISKLFPRGTILITIAANIGETAIADFDVSFPDSLVGIVANENIDNRFLEYYLRTRKAHLNGLAPASAQKNISLETLRPYPVPLPPRDEQLAIADALDAVSLQEAAELNLLSKLKSLKVALMIPLLTGKVRV